MRTTPLRRFTPLRAKTPLKAKTRLKPMSEKNKVERDAWIKVKQERIKLLIAKYGHVVCEYCKAKIEYRETPDAHHNNHRRNGLGNNCLSNCRIVHREPCHRIITDKHIVVESLL